MYVQDVALPSSRNRNKKRTDMAPDYSSNSSMKSSHYNDRPGRNDADTSQTEAVAGEPKIFSSEIAIVLSYFCFISFNFIFKLETYFHLKRKMD